MPRNVNPASISVGAGIAPQGTVEDTSLRNPQRDVEPLRAHLLDPNNAHMAAAIGIVDAGGYFSSTDVEGALQELGGGASAGRQNGLILGGTFTSGPGLLTLDTPTQVLINGTLVSFGGATVVLPPSVTRYVWIDPTTSTLTASAGLPPVNTEPILIAKVVTNAGANITSSQDARFFVANLDRKLDYTLRSDGTAVNDASEACFVTLDAALFWLSNYVTTGQESKTVIIVRGNHTINSTVVVPAGIPNIEFRGEGNAAFVTGAALSPMFDVSGTVGVTFTNLTFRCDHALSVAIATNNAALACSNVTVQNCVFGLGASTWARGIRLYQGAPATQTGHRILDCQFTVLASGVIIDRAVDCVVRDCSLTGNNNVGSLGVHLTRMGGVGENCLVDNVRANDFGFPFSTSTETTTLHKCMSMSGGVTVRGARSIVDGCFFAGITEPMGLEVPINATGTVVSNTTLMSTKVWTAPENPAGIASYADGVLITGCTISGFYNAAGNNGAGVRINGPINNKVIATDVSNCHTGVEVLLNASMALVEGCSIAGKVRGVFADSGTSGLHVTNTTILLDPATGITGVTAMGTEASVIGCKVTTARAFNSYAPGDIPAGVTCGNLGPYLIEGCSFMNFYDSTNHNGGGVCSGDVDNLVISGCTFSNGGVNLGGTNLNTVVVSGCTFYASAATLRHLGVTVFAATALFDVVVSDCAFKFNSNDTYYGVNVSTPGGLNRLVVSNCTYTNTVAPAGIEAFVYVTVASGEKVIIEGNSVSYPTAYTTGCITINGVGSVTLTGNTLVSDNPSVGAVAVAVQAKTVEFTGNTIVGMFGITLVGTGGYLPSLTATGNTIDGADDTAMKGISLFSVGGGAVTAFNTNITGNVITGCLTAVDFTTVGTLALERLTFSGNTVSGCRDGLSTDADNLNGLTLVGNTFDVHNHAFVHSNATGNIEGARIDGNTITQVNFVAPTTANAIVYTLLGSLTDVAVTNNTFSHVGDLGAIYLRAVNATNVCVDGNTSKSLLTASYPVMQVWLTPTVSPTSQVSMSRNRITHPTNNVAGVALFVEAGVANLLVTDLRMDGNDVYTPLLGGTSDKGVTCQVVATLLANTPVNVEGASLCHNTTRTTGIGVEFTTANAAQVGGVQVCHNTSLGPTDASAKSAVLVDLDYSFAVPATAYASNITVSNNTVRDCDTVRGVAVRSVIPVSNLAVEDNSLWDMGTPAGTTLGNVYVYLSNAAGYPTYYAATNVSVSRNKVASSNATTLNYGAYGILLESDAALVTKGANIAVDGNEVLRHNAGGIGVRLAYDELQNLSVRGNKVNTVNKQAILVENADAIVDLSVSDNLVEKALITGVAADGTIEVATLRGEGFMFAGNRLGKTSRKGIFVNGALANGALEGVSFTGNTVDYTNGAAASEDGLCVYWEAGLLGVTVTGNTVGEASTGVRVTGGPLSSVIGTAAVTRIAVTGNTLSADDYGVVVTHQSTNGGGSASLRNVSVSNNAITASSSSGSMTKGVFVEQVFGTALLGGMRLISVANNTVHMGSASSGEGIEVDGNDADILGLSVTGNQVRYGDVGIRVVANDTSFSDVVVSGNNVSDLGAYGINVTGIDGLSNLSVDHNKVNSVAGSGVGIRVAGTATTSTLRNLSVDDNSILYTRGQGLLVQFVKGASGSPEMYNLSVCGNKVEDWNIAATSLLAAVQVSLCTGGAVPLKLLNFNCSRNSCHSSYDWATGFKFDLDERTYQAVFSHNQVLLANNANNGAMTWNFANTSAGEIPRNFTFMGNLFRDTNGAVPVYTGVEGNFATFHGNIGSATNFWTTFASRFDNGGAGTVLPAVISTQNIDDGT